MNALPALLDRLWFRFQGPGWPWGKEGRTATRPNPAESKNRSVTRTRVTACVSSEGEVHSVRRPLSQHKPDNWCTLRTHD